MNSCIPGYKSIATFARAHNLSEATARTQARNGYCAWPRLAQEGQSRDPAYWCWCSMIQRTTNPSVPNAEYYIGRGIKVCIRWRISFEAFLEDVGPRPSLKHSLDRIDPNGHYEPGNVRWATSFEQSQNKRVLNRTRRTSR